MTAILRVDDVSKRFGGYLALSNVSCDVAEGRIHALIGPNGAGKTTLLNVISGLIAPTDGNVEFAGQPYTGRRADAIHSLGIARNFQHVRLFKGLTVLENVMIGNDTQAQSNQPQGQLEQAQQGQPAQQEQAQPDPKTIQLGQSTDEVQAALGKPEKIVNLGPKQLYVYRDLKITFVNGKVSDVQ